MLKLKYLFENFDLAKNAIKHYQYDDLSLIEQFRISANAIYPFKYLDQVYYIRLTPSSETSVERLIQELDLLDFLEEKKYPCIRTVKSLQDKRYIVEEDNESYYGVCSERVPGIRMDKVELTNEIVYKVGASLAEFHELTSDYTSISNYSDVLDRMEVELNEFKNDIDALRRDFNKMKKECFGVVHYDFEPDNLFYDEGVVYPIDFNYAMIHLRTMDIYNTLEEFGEQYNSALLNGYRSVSDLSPNYEEEIVICRRFSKLYKHMRIKHSISEDVENPPEWMVDLRNKLKMIIEE